MADMRTKSDEPPCERSGSGTPVTGRSASTTPMFMNAWPQIQTTMPRVMDAFQTYLRELRPEDLRGSAGLYRLREELLARVNTSAQPAKVTDVLFKEMLVQ